MAGPPVVDYHATSQRPDWRALPEDLRHALAVALGTEIAEAGPSVTSGFTGGFAAPLKLADGREVFVKAAEESTHSYRAYQREAEIVPLLPTAIRVPPIIATARTGRWFAVVAERVRGRMPGVPWSVQDFAAVTASCEVMAEALSPSPELPGVGSFVETVRSAEFPKDLAREILSGDRPEPAGFQSWLGGRLAEVQELVDRYPEALKGDAATHGDLRPDNLLIDQSGQCWTLDWNWLGLGPSWIDWVGLLPLAQRDGIDTLDGAQAQPAHRRRTGRRSRLLRRGDRLLHARQARRTTPTRLHPRAPAPPAALRLGLSRLARGTPGLGLRTSLSRTNRRPDPSGARSAPKHLGPVVRKMRMRL